MIFEGEWLSGRSSMVSFQILFHGRFAGLGDDRPAAEFPYEGFYTSRIINAKSNEDAIARGKELIREELDSNLLAGRQDSLTSLEAEECKEVKIDNFTIINRHGFTFY